MNTAQRHLQTENGWQGKNYDSTIGCKEIRVAIRKDLKAKYPNTKFSITGDHQTVNISVMASNIQILKEDVGSRTVNHYYLEDADYLTEDGKELFKYINELANGFNYDDSDARIDYFDTNFYLSLEIGKWDREYTQN